MGRTPNDSDTALDETQQPSSSGPLTREGDLDIGSYVGEFVIEAVIGRGGFGTVYRAAQPVIGKRVAIKVLARRYSADAAIVSRFIAEARAVNQIRHRNIIDIFSFGNLPDGRAYYVMEHLEGEPFDEYINARGPLSLDETLPILHPIARALDAAHAKGIAHRDLKPENIFIARDDEGAVFPKLLDFGIAKLLGQEDALSHKTNTGVPIGTPYYMSPEQCRGRDVDHRTDIYSFGVLAYRVLSGAYPFTGELIEIMHKQMHEEPPPPSSRNPQISPHADAAVAWMMRKDPSERPHSLVAAVNALRGDRGSQPAYTPGQLAPVTTPVSSSFPPAPRPRRTWLPLVVGTLVVGAAVAAFFVVQSMKSGEPAPVAAPAVATVAPDAAAAPVVVAAVIDAGAPAASPIDAAAMPARFAITIEGAPKDAVVSIAGKRVGTTPKIELPAGDQPVELAVTKDGYLPAKATVVPDRDQTLDIPLRKRSTTTTRPNRDEIIPMPK